MKRFRLNNKIQYSFFLAITRKCNLACPYCYCKETLSDVAIPTIQDIDLCINFIRKIKFLRTITLIGGEPLINKKHILYLFDQIQLLNKRRRNKIKVEIITNGTFYIDLRKYKEILRGIQISLNGFRDVHDISRRYKKNNSGSFDDIIRNYKQYRQDGVPLNIHSVVNHKTITHIAQSLDTLFQQVDFSGVPVDIQIDHYEHWNRYMDKLIRLHWDIFQVSNKFKNNIVNTHWASVSGRTSVCRAGSTLFAIDLVSGIIHGCLEQCGSLFGIVGKLQTGIQRDLVNQSYMEQNIGLYRFSGFPRWLSSWVIRKLPIFICPRRNETHCKSKFVIPVYLLLWLILSTVSKYVYAIKGLRKA